MSKTFGLWNKRERKKFRAIATKREGKEWLSLCPSHNDHHESLRINEEKRCYHCLVCGFSGPLCNPSQLARGNRTHIAATYDYRDEHGKLLFQVVRYDPKDFRQRRPNNQGGWIWNTKGVRRVPYKLPELIAAPDPVFIVEGEKDADNLWKWNLTATTSPMGAKKWKQEYNEYLEGREIVLVPDNHKEGWDHAEQIGQSLFGKAKKVRWLELPGLKEKEDVSDWIEKGGTKDDLLELTKQAPEYNPNRGIYQLGGSCIKREKGSKATILEESPNTEKVADNWTEEMEPTDDRIAGPNALGILLGKYWETTKRRDDFALGIAAYLCKLDWPWAMVGSLLRSVGKTAKNEEIDERLRVLKTAYRKWQTGEPIAGSEKLRDILTATDLEKLEQLAKECRISKEVRIIDRIRCQPKTGKNGKRTFIIDREVCEAVVRNLREKGRFLRVEGGQCYWFNDKEKKVMAIESQMMETALDVKYGINPADKLMRNVTASLRTETISQGEEVRVYRLSHYDTKKNVLYIYAGEGLVYKLDGQRILTVCNGSDGVFFEEIEKEACWKADFDNARDPFETLIKGLSFASGEGVLLAPRYQGIVFWLWLRSLFFEEIQPTKPILVLTGDHGSGKTTALRRVLYFLFGPTGEVSSVKDEQAWTPAITNNYLVVLDNVDKKLKWLPDKLNLAATGQNISIRVLYETNHEYKVTPRCFLALTTVNPPFEEAPVVDRFILLKMKPLDTYISEKAIKRDVLSKRNQLWAGLLGQLNSDINCLTAEDIEVDFRMADWAELCHKLLGEEKNGIETFSTIINGLKQEQSAQVLDCSIVPQILDRWEDDGSGWHSTAKLYRTWKGTAETEDLPFFKSAKGLGMHLSNIRKALHDVYGVSYRKNRRIWEYQFPVTRNREE